MSAIEWEKKHLYNAMESAMLDIAEEMRADMDDWLIQGDHVVGTTGANDLASRLFADAEWQGDELKGIVGSDVYYAVYFHEGTKPHWPPLNAITLWMMKKYNLKGDELMDAAKRVQLKIKKKGTNPHPFMRETFIDWQDRYERELADRVAMRMN